MARQPWEEYTPIPIQEVLDIDGEHIRYGPEEPRPSAEDEIEWLAATLVPYNGEGCGAFSTANAVIAYNRSAAEIVAVVRAADAVIKAWTADDEHSAWNQKGDLHFALDALRAKLREQR